MRHDPLHAARLQAHHMARAVWLTDYCHLFTPRTPRQQKRPFHHQPVSGCFAGHGLALCHSLFPLVRPVSSGENSGCFSLREA